MGLVRKSETELAAPAGYIWADEASRLTGLALKTLYNYRYKGIGPPSTNYRRKVVYKLADVEAWMAEQLAPPPVDPERLWESRPPEPRRLPRQADRLRITDGSDAG
jgi:predicted DNA-binding transcriptional regulator AlpA